LFSGIAAGSAALVGDATGGGFVSAGNDRGRGDLMVAVTLRGLAADGAALSNETVFDVALGLDVAKMRGLSALIPARNHDRPFLSRGGFGA
jgi:hypothetical protein